MEEKYNIHKEYSQSKNFKNFIFIIFFSCLLSCQNEYERKLEGTIWYEYSKLKASEREKNTGNSLKFLPIESYIFFDSNRDFYSCSVNSRKGLTCYLFNNDTDIQYSFLKWSVEGKILRFPFGTNQIKYFGDSTMVLQQFYVRKGDTTFFNPIRRYKMVDSKKFMFIKKIRD
jgi:hypothetical protein